MKDFIVSEEFTIDKIIVKNKETIKYIDTELDVESISNYSIETILEVTPKNNIPVKELYFKGLCVPRAGSKIIAKILKCNEVVSHEIDEYGPFLRTTYEKRDSFKEREKAIEISVLRNGKKVEIYRSADYDTFLQSFNTHSK